MPDHELDISTRVVHVGKRRDVPHGQPVSTPIYTAVSYVYDSMEETDKVFAGEIPGYVYSRHGNPTVAALEGAIRELEGGATACAYASGMAAIHAALLACELSAGSRVLASQDLYGATTNLLIKVLAPLGIETTFADFADLENVQAKVRELKPHVIIAETISNPLLKVCDIDRCAEIARDVRAKLVIDNTFATPYLCRPLAHGADFVVHSATKYLGGHASVTAGVVVARDAAASSALVSVMKLVGGVLGPWQAYELLNGIKTLVLRMERQCTNAATLATRLAEDKRVANLYYPGRARLEEVRARILRRPYAGALVAIEIAPNTRESAFAFMNALQLCARAPSLGDVFTGVLHPATASHRDMPPAQRRKFGINDGLVRISLGIEDVEDIWADIDQALSAAHKATQTANLAAG
jgi:cystathionine beta-lyase/cystathionine gamma-synthase